MRTPREVGAHAARAASGACGAAVTVRAVSRVRAQVRSARCAPRPTVRSSGPWRSRMGDVRQESLKKLDAAECDPPYLLGSVITVPKRHGVLGHVVQSSVADRDAEDMAPEVVEHPLSRRPRRRTTTVRVSRPRRRGRSRSLRHGSPDGGSFHRSAIGASSSVTSGAPRSSSCRSSLSLFSSGRCNRATPS
jgi:hypothetical protein